MSARSDRRHASSGSGVLESKTVSHVLPPEPVFPVKLSEGCPPPARSVPGLMSPGRRMPVKLSWYSVPEKSKNSMSVGVVYAHATGVASAGVIDGPATLKEAITGGAKAAPAMICRRNLRRPELKLSRNRLRSSGAIFDSLRGCPVSDYEN